ncbi:adenylate cyclase [Haemophilus influenzae]|uniref:Adenylate cyclase n=1 Tax=Haemophilus influenzae TaxID=727 RepID=A0A2X1RLK3_HAEIF|nr:adenylate cyclase [Haemophilus influenzae]
MPALLSKIYFQGNTNPDHHFDPYIAILAKVTQYLTALSEFKRLDFVHRCFYVKATEDFARYQANNWRIRYMEILAQEWGMVCRNGKNISISVHFGKLRQ